MMFESKSGSSLHRVAVAGKNGPTFQDRHGIEPLSQASLVPILDRIGPSNGRGEAKGIT